MECTYDNDLMHCDKNKVLHKESDFFFYAIKDTEGLGKIVLVKN